MVVVAVSEAREPTPDGDADVDTELRCAFCQLELTDMEHAADHLEQAHSVITNAILANVDRVETRTVVSDD